MTGGRRLAGMGRAAGGRWPVVKGLRAVMRCPGGLARVTYPRCPDVTARLTGPAW